MPKQVDRAMLMMGKFYELLCKIPVIGYPFARLYNRNIGRMIFYAPGSGAKQQKSIDGIKKYLLKTKEDMGFPFELIPECDTPDSFEFFVGYCPYGYKHPDQSKPCDAAMEMDRVLFRHQGADLTIKESTVNGAPKCRILLKMRK